MSNLYRYSTIIADVNLQTSQSKQASHERFLKNLQQIKKKSSKHSRMQESLSSTLTNRLL